MRQLVLILFLLVSCNLSAQLLTRETVLADFGEYVTKANETLVVVKQPGEENYLTYIFDEGICVNIMVETSTSAKMYEVLRELKFSENERYRVWTNDSNTSVAYILWNWSTNKNYISIYTNK